MQLAVLILLCRILLLIKESTPRKAGVCYQVQVLIGKNSQHVA